MITFSSICDRFLETLGYRKKEFESDQEARKYAYEMPEDSKVWPVFYFQSDTSGEKEYEEFYVPGERLNTVRFQSLGVIEESSRRSLEKLDGFFEELENLFSVPEFTKAEVVSALKKFLPNFEHIEKGKHLDQKM